MADLGFVRNEAARALRAGRSRTLAYVMLDAGNPFFTDVAQGIELAAESADLSLFICNSNNRASREDTHLAHLQQQRVQGILITPVDPDAASLDAIARHGTPLVIVDRTRRGDDSHAQQQHVVARPTETLMHVRRSQLGYVHLNALVWRYD